MFAVMANNPELVQELLSYGADVNAKDKKGFTVLQMAGGQKIRKSTYACKVPVTWDATTRLCLAEIIHSSCQKRSDTVRSA